MKHFDANGQLFVDDPKSLWRKATPDEVHDEFVRELRDVGRLYAEGYRLRTPRAEKRFREFWESFLSRWSPAKMTAALRQQRDDYANLLNEIASFVRSRERDRCISLTGNEPCECAACWIDNVIQEVATKRYT